MYSFFFFSLFASFAAQVSFAFPGLAARQTASTNLIYQYPKDTAFQNLQVRSSGYILLTAIAPGANLYQINPLVTPVTSELLVTIPDVTSLLGIAEIQEDVYAFIAANIPPFVPTARNFSIYHIDLRLGTKVLSKIVDIPDAGFLDGMTALGDQSTTTSSRVLISDTAKGRVYELDPNTKKYRIALSDKATMSPPPDATTPLGVNGIRYYADTSTLYYTNTLKRLFAQVNISTQGQVKATGPYKVIASDVFGDDFALAVDGRQAIVADTIENEVKRVTIPEGQVTVIAGDLNQTTVAGCTSARYGRTRREQSTVYVVTNGARAAPVNGTFTEGGKLVALLPGPI